MTLSRWRLLSASSRPPRREEKHGPTVDDSHLPSVVEFQEREISIAPIWGGRFFLAGA